MLLPEIIKYNNSPEEIQFTNHMLETMEFQFVKTLLTIWPKHAPYLLLRILNV